MVAYLKIILLFATATTVKSQESKKLEGKQKDFCLAPHKKLTNKVKGIEAFDTAPTLQECIKKCADVDTCLGVRFKNPNPEGCIRYKHDQDFAFEANKLALNEFVAFRKKRQADDKGELCTTDGFVKNKELCVDTYYNRAEEDLFPGDPFTGKSYKECYDLCKANEPKCEGFVVNTKKECYPKKKITELGEKREAGTVSTRMTC